MQYIDLLKKYFGYDSFREGQEGIIKSILSQVDTLAIMPTGGGKSICYQIPSLILDGITIVISPLISLMKDQVDGLNQIGIPSIFINSSLTRKELEKYYHEILNNKYKIIYLAPERLENVEFLEKISQIKISQVAIDEAHCISQWGHDFRNSYLKILDFLNLLKERPIITAFTATATLKVKDDIIKQLKMKPNIFITGFDRKNLKYSIIKGISSLEFIKNYLKEHKDESGIIYASTRKEVEKIHTELEKKGYNIGKYHAGLKDREREQYQNDFLNDNTPLIVATNAFGMGIDKSNVRFVIHNNLTKDLESYYQEAGRAGRDGLNSDCILIFNPKDIITQRFFIENSPFHSSEEILRGKYEKLNLMVNYCHTSNCIRSYVLEYFGEIPIENCNNCSNCLDQNEEIDITIIVQKIVSCIGKTGMRYGINMIVGILSGSKNKNLLNWNLDRQSTYGVLSEYSQKEIRSYIDLLIGNGYLEITNGEYPIVQLKSTAISFIKNKENFYMKSIKIEKKVLSENIEVLIELKKIRKNIATREKVPPFLIFSDKTLDEISTKLPQNKIEMLEISGVGEIKYKKYGAEFLEFISTIIPLEEE